MARYIDADVLKEELKMLTIFVTGMLCGKTHLTEVVAEYKKSLFKLIDEQPDADVVPRSEVAREIFGEIGRIVCGEINAVQLDAYNMHIYGDGNQVKEWEKVSYLRGMRRMYDVLYELKKKYEEVEK
jgi:hypothetical protein